MEAGYDNVIVEAHTVGTDDWTTLPEAGGLTDTTPPTECEGGLPAGAAPVPRALPDRRDTCAPTGTTGEWNAITGTSEGWQQVAFDLSGYAGGQVEVAISYVTDPFTGGAGVFVDQTRLIDRRHGGRARGLRDRRWARGRRPARPWAARRTPGTSSGPSPQVGAAITTDDTVLLGFGIEQIPSAAARSAFLGAIVRSLTGGAASAG